METAFGMFEGAKRFNEDISTWNWASIFSGSNPLNSCKKKKRRMRALLQQQTDEESLRLCGEEIGLKQMFKNAPRFNGDVSRWKGQATAFEQENMFEGADSFNTKWKCKTEFDGPTETCKVRHAAEVLEEISEIREFFEALSYVLLCIYMCIYLLYLRANTTSLSSTRSLICSSSKFLSLLFASALFVVVD